MKTKATTKKGKIKYILNNINNDPRQFITLANERANDIYDCTGVFYEYDDLTTEHQREAIDAIKVKRLPIKEYFFRFNGYGHLEAYTLKQLMKYIKETAEHDDLDAIIEKL